MLMLGLSETEDMLALQTVFLGVVTLTILSSSGGKMVMSLERHWTLRLRVKGGNGV